MKLSLLTLALLLPAAAADAPNGKIMGKTSAPIRLEVFSDFSCPGCKQLHEQLLPVLVREFVTPGKAFIVFRDYVLPPNLGHEHSSEAARYAVAANRAGKYMPVADALFATQSSWALSGRISDAIAGVLTPAEQKQVWEYFKDPATAAEVKRDTDAGNRAGLTKTPTVGINFRNTHRMWNYWDDHYVLFLSYLRDLK